MSNTAGNTSASNSAAANGNTPAAGENINVFAHFFPELYGDKRFSDDYTYPTTGKRKRGFLHHETDPEMQKLEIKIQGMPRQYDHDDFQKYLKETLKLEVTNVNWPAHSKRNPDQEPAWVWVTFNTEEEKTKAVSLIHGQIYQGYVLRITGMARPEGADDLPRNNWKKRKWANHDGEPQPDYASPEEAMKYGHIPYCDEPYPEQLKKKEEKIKEVLKTLCSSMLDEWKVVPAADQFIKYYEGQIDKNDGLASKFAGILPAPKTEGFLNSYQFAVGDDANGVRTVGFFIKQMSVVAPITDDVISLPQKMKEAVWAFQKYVQNSPLDVMVRPRWKDPGRKSHWAKLTVRTGYSTNQLCLTIHMFPRSLPSTEIQKVKDDLVDYFTKREGKQCQPTSIYIQYGNNIRDRMECLYGDECLVETICGVKANIYPDQKTPFYKDLGYAEQMYKCVGDLAAVDKKTALLDICCGIGVLGLSLARRAGEVIGIESRKNVVDEAIKNTQLNKITNCQHFHGILEGVLPELLPKLTFNKIVAVLDVPGAGLPPQVYSHLRQVKNLNRIVCLAFRAQDFSHLCSPAAGVIQGEPFKPVKCVGIDAFPHTASYRLAVLLERQPSKN